MSSLYRIQQRSLQPASIHSAGEPKLPPRVVPNPPDSSTATSSLKDTTKYETGWKLPTSVRANTDILQKLHEGVLKLCKHYLRTIAPSKTQASDEATTTSDGKSAIIPSIQTIIRKKQERRLIEIAVRIQLWGDVVESGQITRLAHTAPELHDEVVERLVECTGHLRDLSRWVEARRASPSVEAVVHAVAELDAVLQEADTYLSKQSYGSTLASKLDSDFIDKDFTDAVAPSGKEEDEPDMLRLKCMGRSLRIAFPPFSIAEEKITVRHLQSRVVKALSLAAIGDTVQLWYKDRLMVDQQKPIRHYGCKQGSEIDMVLPLARPSQDTFNYGEHTLGEPDEAELQKYGEEVINGLEYNVDLLMEVLPSIGHVIGEVVAWDITPESSPLGIKARRGSHHMLPHHRVLQPNLSLNTTLAAANPIPHHTPRSAMYMQSPQPSFSPGSGPYATANPYIRHNYPPVNPADQNPPCNTLYVGNLPIDASEDELKAIFSKQSGYRRICFRTKQNGPMCFVEFEDVSFATKALNDLYGVQLHNSVKGGIRLSFSRNPLGVRSGSQGSTVKATTLADDLGDIGTSVPRSSKRLPSGDRPPPPVPPPVSLPGSSPDRPTALYARTTPSVSRPDGEFTYPTYTAGH